MSLCFFFSEWFGDVPTFGTGMRRSMVNIAISGALIFVCMLIHVPADYAAVIVACAFVANGVLAFSYLQQRNRQRG